MSADKPDWIDARGGEAERFLLFVAGAGFLGALTFLGETWDSAPEEIRIEFVESLFWFLRSMFAALIAISIRLTARLIPQLGWAPARVFYVFTLYSALAMLIAGGLGMARALEETLGR